MTRMILGSSDKGINRLAILRFISNISDTLLQRKRIEQIYWSVWVRPNFWGDGLSFRRNLSALLARQRDSYGMTNDLYS